MLVAVSSNAVTAEVTHCDQVLDMNVRCLFSLSQCVAYIEMKHHPVHQFLCHVGCIVPYLLTELSH